MRYVVFVFLLPFIFIGCSKPFNNIFSSDKNLVNSELKVESNKNVSSQLYTNIVLLSENLSEQLFKNHIQLDNNSILVTSFVDLNQLNSTNDFGRQLSENMISSLHNKGFRVKEYRGQSAISVNSSGEFHLTRDIKKLRDEIEANYILIGTYSFINDNTLTVNSRIIDIDNGDIYATAIALYGFAVKKETNSNNTKVIKKQVDIVKDW